MTLHCPQCHMEIANVRSATCGQHGPMHPKPAVPVTVTFKARWK